ncbi:hypothetical protein, partial [Bradyrhizobium ivorense]|uniref:hypothetical protein n=1 Tax=Bradyrhizobium ivorense TaxID=2511166 RepID=UPI001E3BC624
MRTQPDQREKTAPHVAQDPGRTAGIICLNVRWMRAVKTKIRTSRTGLASLVKVEGAAIRPPSAAHCEVRGRNLEP